MLSQQGRQGGYQLQRQQQQQFRLNTLQQQGSQQQLAFSSQQAQQQQTLQPHQQPRQQQQPRKQRFVWGYIDANKADEWTWDDDYNEEAIVSGTDQPWCFFLGF